VVRAAEVQSGVCCGGMCTAAHELEVTVVVVVSALRHMLENIGARQMSVEHAGKVCAVHLHVVLPGLYRYLPTGISGLSWIATNCPAYSGQWF